MASEELIPANEFCTYHHVELSFIHSLHDSGLIVMTIQNGIAFLPTDELPVVEKFVRWRYELSINPEGIEALSHMLHRVEHLLEENRGLRSRLRRYESDSSGISPADYAEL
jgi:chaperone modulatory protein CbpM